MPSHTRPSEAELRKGLGVATADHGQIPATSPPAMDSTIRDATPDGRMRHYEILAETYRQHVDMMLRVIALYLAIVGTAAGFIFTNPPNPARGLALAGFIGLVSAVSVGGCGAAFRWIKSVETPMREHEGILGLPAFAFGGIRDIVWMFGGLAGFILTGTAVLLIVDL